MRKEGWGWPGNRGSGLPEGGRAGWTPKCSKAAFCKLPGSTLQAGPRNAPKRHSGGFLGPLCGQCAEILQNYACVAAKGACADPGLAGCEVFYSPEWHRRCGLCVIMQCQKTVGQFTWWDPVSAACAVTRNIIKITVGATCGSSNRPTRSIVQVLLDSLHIYFPFKLFKHGA